MAQPVYSNRRFLLDSFNKIERKDRPTDNHSAVMVYVKEGLHYKRRHDLEPNRTECIGIKLISKTQHVSFGVFYSPPNYMTLHIFLN